MTGDAGAWVALFPGQGSQAVGMGHDLAGAWDEARATFAEADAVLDEPLSRLCFEGPAEKLQQTRNTQPALLTVSVAAWRVLASRVPAPAAAAGHSLGEYSALVAGGVLDFADALRAVRLRGEAMQEAVPLGEGGMAAVIGPMAEEVAGMCREVARGDEVLVPANFNAPDQTVVAGHRRAVERLVEEGPGLGAKRVIELPVSAPFHSPLMEPAARRLAAQLDGVPFADGDFPVFANVSATAVVSGEDARAKLVEQVASPVRWVETMRHIEAGTGAASGLEVGPGRVLAGLSRRINETLRIRGCGTVETVEAALAALGSGATGDGS